MCKKPINSLAEIFTVSLCTENITDYFHHIGFKYYMLSPEFTAMKARGIHFSSLC